MNLNSSQVPPTPGKGKEEVAAVLGKGLRRALLTPQPGARKQLVVRMCVCVVVVNPQDCQSHIGLNRHTLKAHTGSAGYKAVRTWLGNSATEEFQETRALPTPTLGTRWSSGTCTDCQSGWGLRSSGLQMVILPVCLCRPDNTALSLKRLHFSAHIHF